MKKRKKLLEHNTITNAIFCLIMINYRTSMVISSKLTRCLAPMKSEKCGTLWGTTIGFLWRKYLAQGPAEKELLVKQHKVTILWSFGDGLKKISSLISDYPKWAHFQSMDFLRPTILGLAGISSLDNDESEVMLWESYLAATKTCSVFIGKKLQFCDECVTLRKKI